MTSAVIASGAKITTIAFSDKADDKLEDLATISNGKSYFVEDGSDLDDINDALHGVLTYQPAVKTEDLLFEIFQQEYSETNEISGQFLVDASVGNNVTIMLDFSKGDEIYYKDFSVDIDGEVMTFPCVYENDDIYVYEFAVGSLAAGRYSFNVTVVQPIHYLLITVLSGANNGTLPITTNCWATSSGDINEYYGAIAIVGEVKQGNMPVLNAIVE